MAHHVLILAAGKGLRLESKTPKQFLEIHSLPIIMHSMQAFFSADPTSKIYVALSEDYIGKWSQLCLDYKFQINHEIYIGGNTRQESVFLGLNKILDLSKNLNIYDEIPELLSVSLGAAETTLLNLTSAYAPFVNGGKKIEPTLISRIQDRRGKTIFQKQSRTCLGCDKFVNEGSLLPVIENSNKRILSEETAFQMTSILKGTVERGTAKKLKALKVPLAGKTGTTNDNYDAWFIGFSSNLVVGVYIGFDNPKSLGKYETGSKAALPIFKNFIENSLFRDDFKDFKVPENIFLTALNYDTGLKSSSGDKNTIIEALKEKDINNISNNNLISVNGRDNLVKFRQFY